MQALDCKLAILTTPANKASLQVAAHCPEQVWANGDCAPRGIPSSRGDLCNQGLHVTGSVPRLCPRGRGGPPRHVDARIPKGGHGRCHGVHGQVVVFVHPKVNVPEHEPRGTGGRQARTHVHQQCLVDVRVLSRQRDLHNGHGHGPDCVGDRSGGGNDFLSIQGTAALDDHLDKDTQARGVPRTVCGQCQSRQHSAQVLDPGLSHDGDHFHDVSRGSLGTGGVHGDPRQFVQVRGCE